MSTQVKDVNKIFGDFQALYDINLTIQEGEFLAILGPSGCGKTTLLRMLAGFETTSSGTIEINDQVVASNKKSIPPEKRNVSMVFQSFALWPHMTVSQHIKFPLQYDQFTDKKLKQNTSKRVNEVLEIIDLKDKGNNYPHALSGGQKQRVSLGRAIATQPKLLLMDEPLSALDAELRIEMRREIQRLHQITEASIVYVTHDQGEALAMADRIVVMNKGRIEQVGTPEDIYFRPETEFVATFVSKANLFKGEWINNQFHFEKGQVKWRDLGVTDVLKANNIYALRPEQILLSENFEGKLKGIILTKQFQGKEYHYSIDVNGKVIIVQRPISEVFEIGDWVGIEPVELIN